MLEWVLSFTSSARKARANARVTGYTIATDEWESPTIVEDDGVNITMSDGTTWPSAAVEVALRSGMEVRL